MKTIRPTRQLVDRIAEQMSRHPEKCELMRANNAEDSFANSSLQVLDKIRKDDLDDDGATNQDWKC